MCHQMAGRAAIVGALPAAGRQQLHRAEMAQVMGGFPHIVFPRAKLPKYDWPLLLLDLTVVTLEF